MSNTLSVTLRAFIRADVSFGWAWELWQGDNPLAIEHLDSLSELSRVLRTYAMMVGAILRLKDAGDRFNVTAYGTNSGRAYGRDQWVWDTHCGLYRPHDEPWVPNTTEARQDVSQRASLSAVNPPATPPAGAALAA